VSSRRSITRAGAEATWDGARVASSLNPDGKGSGGAGGGANSLRDATTHTLGSSLWEHRRGTRTTSWLARYPRGSSAQAAGDPEDAGVRVKSLTSGARCDQPASTARGRKVRGTRRRSQHPPSWHGRRSELRRRSLLLATRAISSEPSFHRLTPSAEEYAFRADPRRAEGSRRTSAPVQPIPPSSGPSRRSRRSRSPRSPRQPSARRNPP
jgi:hypothetical protein